MIDGRAIEILEDNIKSTLTVCQWALHCQYHCPKKILKNFLELLRNLYSLKKGYIKRYLVLNKEDIFYSSALELGFENDQALYKFVKRHTGKSLTDFVP